MFSYNAMIYQVFIFLKMWFILVLQLLVIVLNCLAILLAICAVITFLMAMPLWLSMLLALFSACAFAFLDITNDYDEKDRYNKYF